MDGKVKVALHALRVYLTMSYKWLDLASELNYAPAEGKARRMALVRRAEGVVMHDRILTERSIKE